MIEFSKPTEQDLVLRDFPVDVIVETSSYCNLRCIMCPHPTLKRPKGFMQYSMFQKIVDEMAEIKPTSALWLALMGEPLIRPEALAKKVRYAKNRGLADVRLNTNGMLLTTDTAQNLMEAKLDYILISVDAQKKETYAKIRVGGVLPRLKDNINMLLRLRKDMKSKLKVVVQFIVMDENEGEVEEFKEYWLRRKAVVKVRPKLSWGNTVEAKNLSLGQGDRTYPCPWLMRTVSIHWNGTFARCDFDYEGNYGSGNVGEKTIKEVWEGAIREEQLRHIRGDFSHPLCKECRDWQIGKAVYFGGDGTEGARQ